MNLELTTRIRGIFERAAATDEQIPETGKALLEAFEAIPVLNILSRAVGVLGVVSGAASTYKMLILRFAQHCDKKEQLDPASRAAFHRYLAARDKEERTYHEFLSALERHVRQKHGRKPS
jgi:hypothetical protein